MKLFFPLAAGAVLMILLGGCLAGERGPQATPANAVEAYLDAFQQGDLQAMLRLSDSPDTDEDELAFLERFMEMIELESYSIDGVELLSEGEALVNVTLNLLLLGQGKTHRDQIGVIRREGRWYLQGGILETGKIP